MWAGKNAYNLIIFNCNQCCLHFIMSACISDLLYLHLMSFPIEFPIAPFVCSRWKKNNKLIKKTRRLREKYLLENTWRLVKGAGKQFPTLVFFLSCGTFLEIKILLYSALSTFESPISVLVSSLWFHFSCSFAQRDFFYSAK